MHDRPEREKAKTKGLRARRGAVPAASDAGMGPVQLVTAEELAEVLAVSKTSIYDWVQQGLLRPIRVGRGRVLRFEVQDVLRQLAARTEG